MSEPEEDGVIKKWIKGSSSFVNYLIKSGMSKEQIAKVINGLSENKKS